MQTSGDKASLASQGLDFWRTILIWVVSCGPDTEARDQPSEVGSKLAVQMDVRDTLAGIGGSVCLVYAGLPFDTVKLRLQTQHQRAAPPAYRGPVDCLLKMAKTEGIRSLWKGATPAMASAMVENAVLFTANGYLTRLFQGPSGTELTLVRLRGPNPALHGSEHPCRNKMLL